MKLSENELWVCEYSVEQDMFHIGTLDCAIINSYKAIWDNRTDSYMIIGIFETREKAAEYINYFKMNFLVDCIKENGGEWECCSCVYRNDTKYKIKRDTCNRKKDGYKCMEIL